jgi:hypothetical protein
MVVVGSRFSTTTYHTISLRWNIKYKWKKKELINFDSIDKIYNNRLKNVKIHECHIGQIQPFHYDDSLYWSIITVPL